MKVFFIALSFLIFTNESFAASLACSDLFSMRSEPSQLFDIAGEKLDPDSAAKLAAFKEGDILRTTITTRAYTEREYSMAYHDTDAIVSALLTAGIPQQQIFAHISQSPPPVVTVQVRIKSIDQRDKLLNVVAATAEIEQLRMRR